MSEATRCNFCRHKALRLLGCREATPAERLELWDRDCHREFGQGSMFAGGVVMVNREGGFVSWFMELPDHCCC